MANKKPRKDNRTKEEREAVNELEKLVKVIGDKEPTDKQKADKSALVETVKALKFKRIGSQRVGKAIKAIEGIGALAGSGYSRTDEQVEKIGNLIGDALNEMLAKFTTKAKAKDVKTIEL